MNTVLRLFFVFNTFSFLSGCVSSSLLPQTQNVPLFTKEKELQISTQVTARSAELQLAYSAKPHLSFIGNGLIGNLQMADLGVGYYTSVGEYYVFETYVGIGEASLKKYHSIYHINFPTLYSNSGETRFDRDITASKFFIQPNIGYEYYDNLHLSLSVKGSYWYFPKYYYKTERNVIVGSQGRMGFVVDDSVNLKNVECYTLEPAFTFKTGGERLKFMTQVGYLISIDKTDKILPFRYITKSTNPLNTFQNKHTNSYFFLRLGLTFTFGASESQK